jgi:glycosyltransferase involved in cell wall biosynthesis
LIHRRGEGPDGSGAPRPVLLNGKFLSAPPTGVHRVAEQLILGVDRLLAETPGAQGRRWSLLCPRDAYQPLSPRIIQRRRAGLSTWQAWEQIELPALARGGVLVSLCNLAPLAHPRNVVLIHDAQVFLTPGSYPAAFVLWYRFALRRLGRKALRIVTVSEYSRERLAAFGVAPKTAISVVPNGADHFAEVAADGSVLSRLGLASGGFVLAAAGAQRHKNLRVVFEAFRSAPPPGLVLVVVGSDDARRFAAAGDRPPADAVFAGRVTDGELRALYESAACLVFPSTTEGFGLPPLEAMSLGCPVVAAPCGALPEVCGEAALYAAPDDPAAWARAIHSLTRDAGLRAAMVAAGLARAGGYRWTQSARGLLDVIESVA